MTNGHLVQTDHLMTTGQSVSNGHLVTNGRSVTDGLSIANGQLVTNRQSIFNGQQMTNGQLVTNGQLNAKRKRCCMAQHPAVLWLRTRRLDSGGSFQPHHGAALQYLHYVRYHPPLIVWVSSDNGVFRDVCRI